MLIQIDPDQVVNGMVIHTLNADHLPRIQSVGHSFDEITMPQAFRCDCEDFAVNSFTIDNRDHPWITAAIEQSESMCRASCTDELLVLQYAVSR